MLIHRTLVWVLIAVIGLSASWVVAQGLSSADPTTMKKPDDTPGAEAGQTTTKPASTTQPVVPPPKKTLWDQWGMFIIIIAAFVLLYMWMGRSRRKKEAQRKDMLSNLKKGTKITTIGGIKGTVVEVRDDDVTIKVDEQNNVRMKFLRRAIHEVQGEKSEDEKK